MCQLPRDTTRAVSTFAFLATILVVMCHTDDVMPITSRSWVVHFFGGTFSDSNVCNFFFLSGFLLGRHFGEREWWRRSLVSRLHTLVVPYILWCIIDFFASGAFFKERLLLFSAFSGDGGGIANGVVVIAKMMKQVFGLGFLVPPCNFPLWYIKTLLYFILISVVVFPAALRTARQFTVVVVILISFYVLGHSLHLTIMPYFGFCFHLLGFVSFLFGAYCASRDLIILPQWFLTFSPIVPCAIWCIVSMVCFIVTPIVRGSWIILSPVNIAVSIFCLVWIAFSSKVNFSSKYSSVMFFIYAGHMTMLNALSTVVCDLLDSTLCFFVLLGATTAACIVVGRICTSMCPHFTSLLTGGRSEMPKRDIGQNP